MEKLFNVAYNNFQVSSNFTTCQSVYIKVHLQLCPYVPRGGAHDTYQPTQSRSNKSIQVWHEWATLGIKQPKVMGTTRVAKDTLDCLPMLGT